MGGSKLSIPFYVAVGLIAGAIIAYQIGIMRVFSIGTWSHFGSLVVSMAMLGFGVMSAIMCIGTTVFERHWDRLMTLSFYSFGPLMVLGNTLAQSVGFNPIELVADPGQKYKLFQLFVCYFVPFLPGALFLGLAFLKGQAVFGRVYFADLLGSGLCGLAFLVAMYLVAPEWVLMIPVAMWLVASLVWFGADRRFVSVAVVLALAGGAAWMSSRYVQIDVNQYKGVSYARKFEDSRRIYRNYTPFGDLEVYASSYFHFAPGLSDNAALNLEKMPSDAYFGLYIDSDGPIGVLKKLPEAQKAYFRYLPMFAPYVIKAEPNVFVVQLGGGISTEVARTAGAKAITVAEGNPAVLRTLRDVRLIADATGDPLKDKRIAVVNYDGRLYVRGVRDRFDVIDLSLADSTGLSAAGGFAIVEKFNYTRETIREYVEALAPGGVLAITLWNKEEPPKSVPRLFATVVGVAREARPQGFERDLFIFHAYLGTATVLYKKGGFTDDETKKLLAYAEEMSFEVLYHPGATLDLADEDAIYAGYRATFFEAKTAEAEGKPGDPPKKEGEEEDPTAPKGPSLKWGNLYKLMLARFMKGEFDIVQAKYVFDTRPLTDNRPYFAAYVKPGDIPHFLGQLDAVQDEWGYLLLWATLALALIFGFVLLLFPVIWGWKTIFSRVPGKIGIFTYFFCLGFGYIVIEVGLISKFVLALGNPTISASVLICGMLMFSGIGALVADRVVDRARVLMPKIFLAIFALVALGAFFYTPILQAIGSWPYLLRIVACLALLAPAAFLMGFPMASGMTWLSRLGKERFFIWAWGINGCFSVVGAVSVPIISVLFGHATLIMMAACVYLLALPCFFALLKPIPGLKPA
jgi:SAM-dependent methyltransferase